MLTLLSYLRLIKVDTIKSILTILYKRIFIFFTRKNRYFPTI